MNAITRYMIAGVLAVGIVSWLSACRPTAEEHLRRTDGIEVTLLHTRTVANGMSMQAVVTNQTEQMALSIALTAELLDADGRVIAVNPLVSVQRLAPGETRTLVATVPVSDPPASFYPRLAAVLVRWE